MTTKEGIVKLADFGVATSHAISAVNLDISGDQQHEVVGTPNWMAPEIILLDGATSKSDIWSVGCTIVELVTGYPPYHELEQMPALYRVVHDLHPPLPLGISPYLRDFLLSCFQKDPEKRSSAQQLLEHPWIRNALRSCDYDEAVHTIQIGNRRQLRDDHRYSPSSDEEEYDTQRLQIPIDNISPATSTSSPASPHSAIKAGRHIPVLGQAQQHIHLNAQQMRQSVAEKYQQSIVETKLNRYSEQPVQRRSPNSRKQNSPNNEVHKESAREENWDSDFELPQDGFSNSLATKYRRPTTLLPRTTSTRTPATRASASATPIPLTPSSSFSPAVSASSGTPSVVLLGSRERRRTDAFRLSRSARQSMVLPETEDDQTNWDLDFVGELKVKQSRVR